MKILRHLWDKIHPLLCRHEFVDDQDGRPVFINSGDDQFWEKHYYKCAKCGVQYVKGVLWGSSIPHCFFKRMD